MRPTPRAPRWGRRFRDLRHRTAQTILAVAAVGAAVALPVVLLSVGGGVFQHELATIRQSGFEISITTTADHGISDAHALSAEIDRIAGVAAASPILSVAVDLFAPGQGATPVLAEGIVPDAFLATQSAADRSLLPSSIALGDPADTVHYANGSYTGPESRELLLSTALAGTLGIANGSMATLAPTANASAGVGFTVEGTFGLPPSLLGPSALYVVLVPLSDLQTLTGYALGPSGQLLDSADTIQVSVNASLAADPSAIARIAHEIEPLVPYYSVSSQTQTAASLASAAAVLTGFYLGLSSVGLIVGFIFLTIILFRRVEQDRRSIGIRRAIGVSGWMIGRGIAAEALALTGAGLVAGMSGGILVVVLLARYGSSSVAAIARDAVFDPVTLGLLAVALGVLGLVAALLPTRRALALSIPEALR